MIQTYLYRLIGALASVAVITNVYKHGWHPMSIGVGVVLAALICSLGVAPERRTFAWDVRYLMTLVYVLGLAAFRFLL